MQVVAALPMVHVFGVLAHGAVLIQNLILDILKE